MTVGLTMETATKCLTRGSCVQHGYAGQRDDSCPTWDRGRFHQATHNGVQFKTYELVISGICHLIFFGQQLTVGN